MVHCVCRLQCASKLACSESQTKMKPDLQTKNWTVYEYERKHDSMAVCDRTHDNIILLWYTGWAKKWTIF